MSKRGFTLIELLVAVAILSILSSVGLSTFIGAQKKARDARRRADLKSIQNAMEQFYLEEGDYNTGSNDSYYYYLLSTYWGGESCRGNNEPVDPKFSSSPCYLYENVIDNSLTTYQICADLETEGAGFTKTGHWNGERDFCVKNLQ